MTVSLSCDGESGDETLEQEVARAMHEAFKLWKERHREHGDEMTGTAAYVFAKAKVGRLKNWYEGGQVTAKRKLEDSWLDLSLYAVMGLLCERGKWTVR